MPSRRGRSQGLSGVSHALLTLLLLAGCTSVVGGAPHSKYDLPTKAYDAGIYLCPRKLPERVCSGGATSKQIGAVRRRLNGDSHVLQILYLSEADNFRLAKQTLPASASGLIRPGDLPPSFLVTLDDPSIDYARLRVAYESVSGVSTVTDCQNNVRCSVHALRKAGVVP